MKALVRISVVLMLLGPMYATADEDMSVPRGVVYKKASKAINDKAREKIKTLFSHGPEADLQAVFRQMLICGPFLWKEIKDEPEMRAIKTGRAMLKIPQYEGGKVTGIVEKEGKLFQGKEQVAAFWKAFTRKHDLKGELRVTKLAEKDLQTYWAMIPFDIEEPIFIVECGAHRFLMDFGRESMKVVWIDRYDTVGK
jgi:hypothetical protein